MREGQKFSHHGATLLPFQATMILMGNPRVMLYQHVWTNSFLCCLCFSCCFVPSLVSYWKKCTNVRVSRIWDVLLCCIWFRSLISLKTDWWRNNCVYKFLQGEVKFHPTSHCFVTWVLLFHYLEQSYLKTTIWKPYSPQYPWLASPLSAELATVRSDRLYNDGRQCDCRCGMPDPDCALTSSPGWAGQDILYHIGTKLWHSNIGNIQQAIPGRLAAGSPAGFSPPGGFHGEWVEEGIWSYEVMSHDEQKHFHKFCSPNSMFSWPNVLFLLDCWTCLWILSIQELLEHWRPTKQTVEASTIRSLSWVVPISHQWLQHVKGCWLNLIFNFSSLEW